MFGVIKRVAFQNLPVVVVVVAYTGLWSKCGLENTVPGRLQL